MKATNYQRVPIQLHNNLLSCLRKHLALANDFFGYSYPEPEIFYRKKGSIAGSALLQKWQIQINLNMLIDNGIKFIEEVVPHELAHLITYQQFGKVKPHGKEWKYVMETVFKQHAKRTHSFDLPITTQKKRFTYRCQCQTHLLSIIRHKKIQQKQIQYYCKNCATILSIDKTTNIDIS